jgi:hypothetical protein
VGARRRTGGGRDGAQPAVDGAHPRRRAHHGGVATPRSDPRTGSVCTATRGAPPTGRARRSGTAAST